MHSNKNQKSTAQELAATLLLELGANVHLKRGRLIYNLCNKLLRFQIPILTLGSQVTASSPLELKTRRLFPGEKETAPRSPSTVESESIRLKTEILSDISQTVMNGIVPPQIQSEAPALSV